MTTIIYRQIVQRDRLLKQARELDTLKVWQQYKEQRNITFRSIREAKRKFFHDCQENSQDPKEFWRLLKTAMGSNDKPTVSTIRTENNLTHDPLEIANALNEFFVSVASKFGTSSDQEPEQKVLKDFVRTRTSTAITFDIPKITPSFIGKYLSHFQTKKAAGLDGISPRLLRAATPAIVEPLAKIINLCLSNGTFPTSWKIAKVTPVFKAGDILNISNYRPISILTVLSKLLERHVHLALYKYLN